MNSCIPKHLKKSSQYKDFQEAYNASEEAIDVAIYAWAN